MPSDITALDHLRGPNCRRQHSYLPRSSFPCLSLKKGTETHQKSDDSSAERLISKFQTHLNMLSPLRTNPSGTNTPKFVPLTALFVDLLKPGCVNLGVGLKLAELIAWEGRGKRSKEQQKLLVNKQ